MPRITASCLLQYAGRARGAHRWIARGAHLGRYHEIEPTGRPVSVSSISVSRACNDRICEDWIEFDNLGLLRQLGALDQ